MLLLVLVLAVAPTVGLAQQPPAVGQGHENASTFLVDAPVDWPQWGRDPSFHSFSAVHDTAAPAAARGAEWSFAAGDRVVSSPAVVGERIWFGSDDGHMYCLNRTTGALLWSFATTGGAPGCVGNPCEHGLCPCGKVRSSPAVSADLSVVFGSYDFAVYKLDVAGQLLWRTPTRGAVYGPATVDRADGGGAVYIGSFDEGLYKLRGADGAVLWRAALGAHGDSGWALGRAGGAAAAAGLVFGVSNEGGLCTSWPPPDCPSPSPSPGGGSCFAFAINASTGGVVWRAPTGGPGGGGMLAAGAFIAGAWTGNLTSFDARTGSVRWSADLGGEIESHPALGPGGDVVFASAEESRALYALDRATGRELWRYTGAGEELNGSPSVTLDTVFVGSNDHFLHAVDRTTGAFKFKIKTCANVFSSAAIADDGMAYIACNTETGPTWNETGVGAVYAIDPALHQ